ncbi:Sodium/calcium exchanger protein-domain-containing protein [Copromyces sp. CBS 386.78]|nr:Sodium/calcium exchanger protein-domain-containing protein [Copromyces sp. CBS 386.78]
MSLLRQKRSPFSSRPFIVSTLLITCLATYALVLRPFATSRLLRQPEYQQQQQQQDVARILARGHKHEPTAPVDCRDVHLAQDQCAFILANCEDEEAGLIHYLAFYYCTLPNAKPVAFAVLTAWLGLLFTTIGIAASDFFSINLSTISSVLGLSENLAGVTFLALGNGSPDVFSTFAAMSSNSGSMAVGELIGAAGFITAVVAGSMALVCEFKVQKRTFVRDIIYFIIAISFTMLFLLDQELHLWEANTMVGCYVCYVILVFAWQWFTDRRRKRKQREAAARTHYHGSAPGTSEELEPYRDDPEDDEAASVNTRPRTAQTDISALERGPRIEIEGQGVASTPSEEEEDEHRDLHVAAEMTSSMRVNRPRWGRSNTTITPIRPSLVGALEFRSILSSLQKERNLQAGYFQRGHRRGHSDYFSNPTSLPLIHEDQLYRGRQYTLDTLPTLSTIVSGRDRALSSGHSPLNLDNSGLPAVSSGSERGDTSPALAPGPRPNESPNLRPDTRGSSTTRTVDGRLAPPLDTGGVNQGLLQHQWRKTPRTLGLHLQIPESTGSSIRASPTTLSPFPVFSESPTMLTPQQLPESAFVFPTPSERRRSSIAIFGGYEEEEKPLKYWPYSILPPPHIFFGTLFPTLQGWSEKSWWDKLVSLISAPSVFVLAITLPVVETESEHEDDDEVEGPAESPVTHLIHSHGQPGHMAVPISLESSAHIRPDTEWQEFRRRTRSASNRSPLRSPMARSPLHSPLTASPSFVTLDSPRTRFNFEAREHTNGQTNLGAQVQQAMKLNPHQRHGHSRQASQPTIVEEDEHGITSTHTGVTLADNYPNDTNNDSQENEEKAAEEGWSRWLISLQLFTGPLFVVLILWANTLDELPSPSRALLHMVLYSSIFSLTCLGILLLTTSADKKPKYHFLLCFLGFVISIAWISTIANEVVGILKAFGVILGISEAILGLTIFAVGNSLGDLVADVTVARLGWPVMALAACFGGPMLNILLGIGLGGAWMIVSSANKHHAKHPELPFKYKPYKLQVGGTLMISAITVLVTLVSLLILVPSNGWVMNKRIGWTLIGIWTVGTVFNLVVETTGVWTDVR